MIKLLYWPGLAVAMLLISQYNSAQTSFPKESPLFNKNSAQQQNPADLSLQQEIEMTKDPLLGYVPHERLMNAIQYAEELQNSGTRGAIPGIIWKERGPNQSGGRTQAIMIDPNDASMKTVLPFVCRDSTKINSPQICPTRL